MSPSSALRPGLDQPNPVVACSKASSSAAWRSAVCADGDDPHRLRRQAQPADHRLGVGAALQQPDDQVRLHLPLQVGAGPGTQQVQCDRARAVRQRAEMSAGQRALAGHPHPAEQFAAGPRRHGHPPGQAVPGIGRHEHRLVRRSQPGEHPLLLEQLAQPVGDAPGEDGLQPGRVARLLGAGVGQHPRVPVLDGHRPADDVGQAVGQGEQVGRAASGGCLTALQHQPVHHAGELAPRDGGIGQQDGHPVPVAERGGVPLDVRAAFGRADQDRCGSEGGGPLHRLGDRGGADGQEQVAGGVAVGGIGHRHAA
ncbi:hypothetical protein [Nonomuraea sp. NPDC003201]